MGDSPGRIPQALKLGPNVGAGVSEAVDLGIGGLGAAPPGSIGGLGAAPPGSTDRLVEWLEGRRVVTVFGSSRAQPEDAEYIAAMELGRLLATRGWAVCNGGFGGTMTAAAQGAKEAGGFTIGITVSIYEDPVPNPWIDRNIVAQSLFTRLEHLVSLGQAYVVLKGGIGTLLELAMVWNLVQSVQQGRPVIVVGDEWAEVTRVLRGRLPMHPWEARSITLVSTVAEAVALLDVHFSSARG